jgi:hypothetical protein
LERRPEIPAGYEYLGEAFARLSAARGGAWGPEPIKVGEIEAYCRLMGYGSPDERGEILTLLQAMDAEYLKWAAEKRRRD